MQIRQMKECTILTFFLKGLNLLVKKHENVLIIFGIFKNMKVYMFEI